MPITRRTSGRYAASETGLEIMPKHYRRDGSMPGVILLHGNAEDETQAFGRSPLTNHQTLIANALADAGFPCFAPLAGGNAMCNDTAIARVTDAYNYLTGTLGAKSGKVVLLGLSMGGGTAQVWYRANPTLVSCMVLCEPLSDMADVVNNNRASAADSVNIAYGGRHDSCGTTNGSSTVTDTSAVAGDVGKAVWGPGIPAGTEVASVNAGLSFTMRNQVTKAAVSATASGTGVQLTIGGYHNVTHGPTHNPESFKAQLAGSKAQVWYATDDTVVIPSTVQSIINAAGWTDVHTVPGDHGSSMYNQIDVPTVVDFVRANAWS